MKTAKMGIVLVVALLMSQVVACFATAAQVTASVLAVDPKGEKTDKDSVSGIALFISTRDLSKTQGGAEANAYATIFTRFFSRARASGSAEGAGTRYDAEAMTQYLGSKGDYEHAWGPKKDPPELLNIILPAVQLSVTGTGVSLYSFSFFETNDPSVVLYSGSVTLSSSGLSTSGALSPGDFSLSQGGYSLINTVRTIDVSSVPSDANLTFDNSWSSTGTGNGSSISQAVPEPSSLLLLLLGGICLCMCYLRNH